MMWILVLSSVVGTASPVMLSGYTESTCIEAGKAAAKQKHIRWTCFPAPGADKSHTH